MASSSADESIVPRMVFGLAFAAAGLLIVALAPHRTLDCAHPARAPAVACPLVDSAQGADGEAADDESADIGTSDCPSPPDIQCRLQAKVLGLITSEDVRLGGIQRFDLLVEKSRRRATRAYKRSTKSAEFTLRFVVGEQPVDLGWNAKAFATWQRHDRLEAFARNPAAARIELIDSPKLPLVAGLIMTALGVVIVLGALSSRR